VPRDAMLRDEAPACQVEIAVPEEVTGEERVDGEAEQPRSRDPTQPRIGESDTESPHLAGPAWELARL
jgi:hypothetical protein